MIKPRVYILEQEETVCPKDNDGQFEWFGYNRARDVLFSLQDMPHNDTIVCIDASIRDMDWRVVLDQIYRHSFSTNCILMDKNYNVHTAIESAKLGAMDYWPYPITSNDMTSRIELIRRYPLSRKKWKDMFLRDEVSNREDKDVLAKLIAVKLDDTNTDVDVEETTGGMSSYNDFYLYLNSSRRLDTLTLKDTLNNLECYLGLTLDSLEKPSLLIVEDDYSVVASMTMILSDYFELYSASSAKDAIDILKSVPTISLVTIDYNLPDMTGSELFEWCQLNYPEILAVFVTASHDPNLALSMIKEGSVDYITKPFEPYDLIKSLSSALCRAIWPFFEDEIDIHDLSYSQRTAFLSYDLIRLEQTQSMLDTGRLLALFPELEIPQK